MTSPTLPRDESEALTRELAWAMSELQAANEKNNRLVAENQRLMRIIEKQRTEEE